MRCRSGDVEKLVNPAEALFLAARILLQLLTRDLNPPTGLEVGEHRMTELDQLIDQCIAFPGC